MLHSAYVAPLADRQACFSVEWGEVRRKYARGELTLKEAQKEAVRLRRKYRLEA